MEDYVVPERKIPHGGMWMGQFNTHVQWAKDGFDLEHSYSHGSLCDLVMLLSDAYFSVKFEDITAIEKLIRA